MKRCRICLAEKPLSEFYKHPESRDGHLGACKPCESARALARYWRNRDAYLVKTKTAEWRLKRKLRGLNVAQGA